MDLVKQGYSEPKLHDSGSDVSKEWYVDFRYTCPQCQVRKPYQHRMGINFLKTVEGRRTEAKAVIGILSKALKANWNPHHEAIEDFLRRQLEERPLSAEDPGKMPFNQALDYFLGKKKPHITVKTVTDFTTTKDYAQTAAIELGYFDIPIQDIKRRHIKDILEQICRARQAVYDGNPKRWKGKIVTGNFYNKQREFLSCILSEAVEYEAIEYNPCEKIKSKPEITTNVHRHATEAERVLIKSTLQLKCINFYYYLAFEHLTGIRPKELFFIRICDIDWFNQMFNLRAEGGATKTRKARQVPIPDVAMKYLKAMNLERFPVTYYLFSNAFRPGEERKNRDYATKLWKEIIKDGLGLNVSLYSFKGLGGEEKRMAGVPLAAVSSQYGHSSVGMTMKYTYNEKERMNKEIREKTPDF